MRSIVGAVMVLAGAVGLAWRGVARLGERAELLRGLQGALAISGGRDKLSLYPSAQAV